MVRDQFRAQYLILGIGSFAAEVALNPHVRLLSLICKIHNVQTLHYRNI